MTICADRKSMPASNRIVISYKAQVVRSAVAAGNEERGSSSRAPPVEGERENSVLSSQERSVSNGFYWLSGTDYSRCAFTLRVALRAIAAAARRRRTVLVLCRRFELTCRTRGWPPTVCKNS